MDNNTQKIVNKADKIDVGQQTNNIYNLLDFKAAIILFVCVFAVIGGFLLDKNLNSNNDNTANTNSTAIIEANKLNTNAQPTITPTNTNVIENKADVKANIERPKPTPTIKPSPTPVKIPKKTPKPNVATKKEPKNNNTTTKNSNKPCYGIETTDPSDDSCE